VDEAQWVERNAAQLGRTLADPAVRARVLELLSGTDAGRRERRLQAARRELAGLELRWRLEDEHAKP
jgi:hypothetical protein